MQGVPPVRRMMTDHALTPADLNLHASKGISAELLASAAERVTDRQARELFGIKGSSGDYSGVVYHYYNPITGRRATSRMRLDNPPLNADGAPEKKYHAGFGDNRHLYFPPGVGALLADASVHVVIVESEKAALAIMAAAERAGRRVLVIACGGCWGWTGRIGKVVGPTGERKDEKGALPDFGLVAWTPDRSTVILFDARPNASVLAASRRLARELRGRGADVRQGHLPDDDHRVNGPDDLVAAQGDAALWRVIDEAMPEDFKRRKSGAVLADDLDNIRLALMKLGVVLRYDAFAHQIVMNGVALDDVGLDRLWVRINDSFSFRPSKDTLRTVLVDEAHGATFHPVCDYLDGLTWDGTPRLDDWLITYGGAEPSAYVRAVGALPLIAAVRRVREAGAKFDELLVLESSQGQGKSSALRILCANEGWFSDDLPLGVDSKHVIERTAGKWLIEAAEMHGNRGREAEQLKAFLSRQVDGPVRLAYGRLPTSVPRQFVMIGTTNASTAYLKDSTGARRFWPVRVQRFDVVGLRRDRDQLWAEAAAREALGVSIRLAAELWHDAGLQQEQRRASDPWEDVLEPLLDNDDDEVAATAIWTALKLEEGYRDTRHNDRLASILQRHGYTERRKCRRGGPPAWHWFRVPTVPSAVPSESSNSLYVPTVPSVPSISIREHLMKTKKGDPVGPIGTNGTDGTGALS